jgi:hypothetical protein
MRANEGLRLRERIAKAAKDARAALVTREIRMEVISGAARGS